MVEHLPTGDINAVEDSGNFAANDTSSRSFAAVTPAGPKCAIKTSACNDVAT